MADTSERLEIDLSILIKNITAVTMDDKRPVIETASVAVKSGRIFKITESVPDDMNEYDEIIDGEGMVAAPGLINTHTHAAMTLMRSYADDMNLQNWLNDKIFPYEDKMTPADVYRGSQIGLREMLESGTTCFNDMYFFQEDTAMAAKEIGIRAVLNDCVTDGAFEDKVKKTEKLISDFCDESRMISVNIAPHSVYTCSPETLKKCAEYAKSAGLDIHTHLSETEVENIDCVRDYGVSPTKHMENCGLFGVRSVAAHCVWLSDEDMDILLKHNVSVSHNPTSNLKLASGVAEVQKMIDKGINVCLGTDGASSNNNLDMFEEMKLAALLQKGILRQPTAVPAYQALKMATVNGAKALGFDDLGALKEGYLADMIILDFNRPHLTPNNDVIANLVYSANGGDVAMTIVGGKIVYRKKGSKFDE